jgi:hypothetical protein
MVDDPKTSYLPEEGGSNEIFSSRKYYFPFSQVKVTSLALKELQVPMKITTIEILKQLGKFVENFPFHVIPVNEHEPIGDNSTGMLTNTIDSKKDSKLSSIINQRGTGLLRRGDIELVKEIMKSEEAARVIGIVLHLSYWQVFGHLNPVQPDILTKKQMVIACIDHINKMRKRAKVRYNKSFIYVNRMLKCGRCL